jgi:hypothetical protein
MGLSAIGCDVDPLAVLMAKVWTTPVDDGAITSLFDEMITEASSLKRRAIKLPWIDNDDETRLYVEYWFGEKQRDSLRRFALVLSELGTRRYRAKKRAALNVLRLALSRIIITKSAGASLGKDISHSRPHKVSESSDFDIGLGLERSVRQIRKLLSENPPPGCVEVRQSDARCLNTIGSASIDAVVTSPPYLNAIDYMRGHRLALVWLGYSLAELRAIRSGSVGTERRPDNRCSNDLYEKILKSMLPDGESQLRSRHRGMLIRYAEDAHRLTSELSRVIKPGGSAILVVGNSCIKGTFVKNSNGFREAAQLAGLDLFNETERELPEGNRYLPMPAAGSGPLGNRMRTETILAFRKI